MLATFAVLLAAVQMPPCAAVPPPAVQFTPGEQLKFRLDLLGADVGTFDVSLERAPASEGAAAPQRKGPATREPPRVGAAIGR